MNERLIGPLYPLVVHRMPFRLPPPNLLDQLRLRPVSPLFDAGIWNAERLDESDPSYPSITEVIQKVARYIACQDRLSLRNLLSDPLHNITLVPASPLLTMLVWVKARSLKRFRPTARKPLDRCGIQRRVMLLYITRVQRDRSEEHT